ncbi:MAG TPA: TetR/AcrR family transcriptional regulator [Candidatus Baltobacteraceae bacterium]
MRSVALAPGKRDGRRLRGDRSRAAILKHAVDVASVAGLAGLTFGQLAEALQLSKGNLTVLFRDKEALQLAVLDTAVERFSEVVVVPGAAQATAIGRLRSLCDGWYRYLECKTFPGGCFIYAAAHEYRARPGAIQDRVVAYFDVWKRKLGAEIRNARQRGEIRQVSTRECVVTLIAYQNAAHLAMLLGDLETFSEARRLTRVFIDGLAEHAR